MDEKTEIASEIKSSQPAVKIISVTTAVQRTVADALPRLRQSHHLDGVVVECKPPLFLLKTTEPFPTRSPLTVLVWGWDGFFGGSVTITIAWASVSDPGRIAFGTLQISQTEEALKELRSRRFTVAFADKSGQVANQVVSINYGHTAASRTFLDEQLSRATSNSPRYADQLAHFWESLELRAVQSNWTRLDRLRIGWLETYKSRVSTLDFYRSRFFFGDGSIAVDRLANMVEEQHRNLVLQLADRSIPTTQLVDHFYSEFGCDEMRFGRIMIPFNSPTSTASPEESSDVIKFRSLLMIIFGVIRVRPDVTDCGRNLRWTDFLRRTTSSLRIDSEAIPKNRDPREFWPSLPIFCSGWPELLEAGDFPLTSEWCVRNWQQFPVTDDIQGSNDLSSALLHEAWENKSGTIPPHAIVELRAGPFSLIELQEHADSVEFLFRRETGEFLSGFVNPRDNDFCIGIPLLDIKMEGLGKTPENAPAVEAALRLLICAIVRDFWIVEKREQVFGTKRVAPRAKQPGRKNDSTRIVYLPRIRYEQQSSPNKVSLDLGLEARPSHPVSAHLRRLHEEHEASQVALFLAQRYGIKVPQGYTFVRPYATGQEKRDVIFRSRSALQTLYHALPSWQARESHSDWFRFEKDVCEFMKASGFDVEHVSVASSADHGIDVYATKGSKLNRICWVIQCKCWQTKRHVGPDVVRDLLGALERHPRGTRGMVITTSTFTDGAKELAATSDVLLVDGPEFYKTFKNFIPTVAEPT